MLYLVSGINSLYLFVNLILVPVPPFATHLFFHPSLFPRLTHHFPLCSSVTPFLFHSLLKRTFFKSLTLRSFTFSSRIAFTYYWSDRFFWATPFLFLVFLIFCFCAVRYTKLAISSAFERYVNVSFRIVSYRVVQKRPGRNQHSQEYKHPRRQCSCDLDLWTFNPKRNDFPGLIVENFCVKFGDPSCVGFWDIVQKNRPTQTYGGDVETPPGDCTRRVYRNQLRRTYSRSTLHLYCFIHDDNDV